MAVWGSDRLGEIPAMRDKKADKAARSGAGKEGGDSDSKGEFGKKSGKGEWRIGEG